MILALLFACAPSQGAALTLLDGRTGAPVAARFTLTPDPPRALCPPIDGQTNASGRADTPPLCDHPHTLTLAAPWAALDVVTLRPGAERTVRVWPAASEDGVWRWSDGALRPLLPNTTVDELRPVGATTTVRLPVELPSDLPTISGDDALVLVGPALGWSIVPLVPNGPARFDDGVRVTELEPWVYAGVRFVDGAPVPVATPLGAAEVVEQTVGGRLHRYVGAAAVGAGTYLVGDPGVPRGVLVAFDAAAGVSLAAP